MNLPYARGRVRGGERVIVIRRGRETQGKGGRFVGREIKISRIEGIAAALSFHFRLKVCLYYRDVIYILYFCK
jgi:hypothetical protein